MTGRRGGRSARVASALRDAARGVEAVRPADLARRHGSDPFVAPSRLDQRALIAADAAVAATFPPEWALVELSPVAPLGSCSVVTPGSQNRVLPAARDTEVLADPTNALALEAAVRRAASAESVRLATSARVVRHQRFTDPRFSQHFRLWGLLIAGRDPGGHTFELDAVAEIVAAAHAALDALQGLGARLQRRRVRLLAPTPAPHWVEQLAARLGATLHPLEGNYYAGLRWQIDVAPADDWLPIADGGVVDWLARLRSDRKEKAVIGGIGTEMALALRAP